MQPFTIFQHVGTRQKVCTCLLQTHCFQKLTLSIPSWLNLEKETHIHKKTGKIGHVLWAVTAFVDFRGCMTFVSKFWQFQAIGHAPRWSASSQRAAECSQEEMASSFTKRCSTMARWLMGAHPRFPSTPRWCLLCLPGELHVSDTALIHVLHVPEHSLLLLMSLQHIPWENPDVNTGALFHDTSPSQDPKTYHIFVTYNNSCRFCRINIFMWIFLRKAPAPLSPSTHSENWLGVCLIACGLIPELQKIQVGRASFRCAHVIRMPQSKKIHPLSEERGRRRLSLLLGTLS